MKTHESIALTDMTRRDALRTISAVGVCAAWPILGQGAPLKFFTADENDIVIALSEHIIPADEHSPGAKAARVNEITDLVLSRSPVTTQQAWRDGLRAMDRVSVEMFERPVKQTTPAEQIALLTAIGRNERNPRTEAERFFVRLKNATIDGYYTSKIGLEQDLAHYGTEHLKEFPGCTHPEHQ